MNLYVDDQRPCPPGWTIARTIDDAIRILSDGMTGINPVEVVDMDHDIHYDFKIEGKEYHLDSPETFQPIVRYIALMPEEWRPEVRYHTANPTGETKMR